MKFEQISKHIWSVKAWLIFPLQVWVVIDKEGVTLVDAGMPFMSKGIVRLIDRLQAGPLKQILLTHGHTDHIGSVKTILQKQTIPVYAHQIELPYLEGKTAYPRRKKPERNLLQGLIQPLRQDSNGNLEQIAGLKPYLTPGHSPGHVVYYHQEDQVLLAGDLCTAKKGKLRPPMAMFTSDMAEALKSSTIIRQLNPLRLEASHGGTVLNPDQQFDQYINQTASKFSISYEV